VRYLAVLITPRSDEMHINTSEFRPVALLRRIQQSNEVPQVYGWFTEGLDTPDLIEAKALLDNLG